MMVQSLKLCLHEKHLSDTFPYINNELYITKPVIYLERDKNTEDKVKKYQKEKGLVQDGVAGKDTWKCMIEDMMNMKK